jgi:predicted glycosyltransferase
MKAIIVTNNLGERSGWERYSLDLVESLSKKGVDVFVVCHKKMKTIKILNN